MNKIIVFSLGLLTAVAPLSAQSNPQAQSESAGSTRPPWKKHGKQQGPFGGADLTAEEQQRLAAAREKAGADPTVQSLREAKDKIGEQLASATRAAMLAADPSLGPTLAKITEVRDRANEMRGKFESLTPEQKQQLKAAREAAKNDPAVQAAREKMRAAQGPENKGAAAREMHDAMKAAMLKADPTLGPLLEKLGPGMMGEHPRHGGGPHGEEPDGPPPPDMGPPMGERGLE